MKIRINGVEREVLASSSLETVLVAELGGAPSGVAMALNECVVPRSAWAGTTLADGDELLIVQAVQGG